MNSFLYKTIALAVFVSLIALSGAFPEQTYAQYMQRASTLSLTVNPQFPMPNSTVTVSVSDYGMDTSAATIEWMVDGAALPDSRNAREIQIPTGTGERAITVEARIRGGASFASETLTKTIAPGAVDIIVEPQTTAPLTFRGKPLASSGSSVRAVAVPHLYRNGKAIPVSETLFTWMINGTTILGGAQLGTNVTTVSVPRYGNLEIAVIAEAKDGSRSARATTRVEPASSRVIFYELSSLYGTVMEAPYRFATTKDEISIIAFPYNMDESVRAGRNLTHTWTVDGTTVTPETDPRIVTLTREGNGLIRRVQYSYTSDSVSTARGVGEFEVSFMNDSNAALPTI